MNIVKKAEEFAIALHTEQRKWSGEPYHNHLRRVTNTVFLFTDNPDLLAGTWLHDSHEDYPEVVPLSRLANEFNNLVATLVYELTNVYVRENSLYKNWNRDKRKTAECERLARCSYSARLIKLADRLDNITCYKQQDPEFIDHGYYVSETRQLLEALEGTNTILEEKIRNIIGG
jgi:(p)ppGpp synthase/HD superfamily hydrolase